MIERILLIQPRSTMSIGFSHLIFAEPLPLEAVSCFLVEKEVQILDLRIEKEFEKKIRKFDPHLVGLSCSFTMDVPYVLSLARDIKKIKKDVRIVVGGHHVTLNASDFDFSYIDHVILGEGEFALKKLVEDGTGEKFIEAPIIEDLDSLPCLPRYLTEKYRKRYHLGFKRPLSLVETARGCPFRCLFCSVWVFYKGRYRKKSPEKVLMELDSIDTPYILFTDDNFLLDIERSFKLAELIRQANIRKNYIAQVRSDTVVEQPELIKLWKSVGLCGVFIGFEKIKDDDLKFINKRNSVKNNETALEFLNRMKIDVWSSFIVDPSFEKSDFDELLSYVKQKIIKNPTFSILTPLPGTEFFEKMKTHLTTRDHRLFDIAHVVLPTRLSLREFYREFCNLYRKSYSKTSLLAEGIFCFFKNVTALPELLKMLYNVYRLTRPSFYIKLHKKLE